MVNLNKEVDFEKNITFLTMNKRNLIASAKQYGDYDLYIFA